MKIEAFFDRNTATFSYVVSDESTGKCAIIDSVLNYDMRSGRSATTEADKIISYVKANNLEVEWILETHIHADHITGAAYLKKKLGGKTAIGEHVLDVLSFWVPMFNIGHDTPLDGSQFDHLLKDGEVIKIGSLDVKVIYTPGHTPSCVCYHVGDAVFTGDTIFMPYVGTGRTDFPGGSAATLYKSITGLLELPSQTRMFVGHDYPLAGNAEACSATVAEQKKSNIILHEGISEQDYVKERNGRDKNKEVPRLLFPALQANLRGGEFGQPESNGVQYIKVPLNRI